MTKRHEERLHDALQSVHAHFFPESGRGLRDEYAFHLLSCPVCECSDLTRAMEKDGFSFDRCTRCGMVFLNPRLNDAATYAFYDSEWIQIYNEQKFHGNSASNDSDRKENRHLLSLLGDHGALAGANLLEIGPGGEGTFINEALLQNCKITAIELGKDNCAHLQKRFADSIVLLNTTLEQAALPDNYFDFISMRDVLEHIPNPMLFLHEINRVLKPGGLLLVHVPNIAGMIYRVVREKHTVVFGFEHPNYWSPRSLGYALKLSGFNIVQEEHASSDFTLGALCHYWFGPATFTTVHPPQRSKAQILCHRVFGKLLSLPLIKHLDHWLMPRIADKLLKRGSTITLVARKKQ